MINVNQITAQMARMPDQALQQYAEMHKDDPYTLSLALNESNRRKQMRAEAQTGPNGQQPTVVDQGIAEIGQQPQPQMPQGQPQPQPQPQQQMPQGQPQQPQSAPMPEDVGIGALPAPNMQSMAEGGIVSFADGGEVQSFQSGGTAIGDIQAQSVAALKPLQAQVDQAEQMYVAAARSGDHAAITRYGKALSDLKAQLAEKISTQFGNAGAAVREQLKPAAPAVSSAYADEGSRGAMTSPVRPVSAANPVALGGLGSTAPAAKARGPVAPAPTPTPAAPAPATPLTIDQYMPKEPLTDPFAVQRGELGAARTAAVEQAKREFEADVASRPLAFEGKEKRLGERQSKLTEQTEANKNMSIVEAGLAMMQSRGRGLAGLAEGAGVGLRSYKSGIEKLTAAQERIDDARDQMDEFRRNEANMTNKERRSFSSAITDSVLKAKEDALTGTMQAFNLKRDDAKTMFNAASQAQQGELNRGSAESIAALGRASAERIARMPGGQMQLLTALGGKGGVEAGLRLLTEIQAGKLTPVQSYEKYLQGFAGKDTSLSPPMPAAQYIALIKQAEFAANPGRVPGAIDTTPNRP
jgi:hypothetical protein